MNISKSLDELKRPTQEEVEHYIFEYELGSVAKEKDSFYYEVDCCYRHHGIMSKEMEKAIDVFIEDVLTDVLDKYKVFENRKRTLKENISDLNYTLLHEYDINLRDYAEEEAKYLIEHIAVVEIGR